MKFLVLLFLLLSQTIANAQNPTCPNRPNGDSSNACANTRFVIQNAGGTPSLANNLIFVGNASNIATAVAMSGDCTIVAVGTITCTKTNGVAFGTAATTNIGTSGATIPLLSTANVWSLAQTFTAAPVFTDASGTRTALGLGTIATQNANNVNISGGAINNTPIGGVTPNTIAATTGTFTGAVSITTTSFGGLTVASNSTNSTGINLNNTAASGRNWSLYSSGGGPAAAGLFGIFDSTASATRLSVDASGNVGIGTVTQTAQLQNTGSVLLGSSGGTFKSNNTGIGGIPGCINSDGASPANLTAGPCGTGLPSGGTVGQEVLNVASGTGNWFTPPYYNIATNSGTDCSGATATVLSTVIGGNVNAFIPPGCTIKVSADDSIAITKTLLVACGATITVDSGKVLKIKGTFFDPGQCAIFAGAGTVTSIGRARPEWWACEGNTGSFDQGCLQKAINSSLSAQVEGSNGTERVVQLGCKTYYISATVTLTPANGNVSKIIGCGSVTNSGTTILAKSSFTGTAGLYVGAASTVCCLNFTLKGFSVFNEAVAGGPASGLEIGSSGPSYISSFNPSFVSDITSAGFAKQFYVHDIRQIVFNSIIGVANDSSGAEKASSSCLTIDNQFGFTGDLDFYNFQCTGPFGSGAPTGNNIYINAPVSGVSVNGVRFHNTIQYGGAVQLAIATSGGGFIGDVWVNPGSQFEGPTPGTSTAVSAAFATGTNFNFHFDGLYMSGNGFKNHIAMTGAGGVAIFNIYITNNFLANPNGGFASVNITNGGSDLRGIVISNNSVYAPSTGGANQSVMILNGATRSTMMGNNCNGAATSRNNFISVTNSQLFNVKGTAGGGCTVTSTVDTTGSTAPFDVSGNI